MFLDRMSSLQVSNLLSGALGCGEKEACIIRLVEVEVGFSILSVVCVALVGISLGSLSRSFGSIGKLEYGLVGN